MAQEVTVSLKAQDIAEELYLGKEVSPKDQGILNVELQRLIHAQAAGNLGFGSALWLMYSLKYATVQLSWPDKSEQFEVQRTLRDGLHNERIKKDENKVLRDNG